MAMNRDELHVEVSVGFNLGQPNGINNKLIQLVVRWQFKLKLIVI